jgi:hypothetical protein
MTTGGKLSMDVRRECSNQEKTNDRAFHVDTLTASYEGSLPTASFPNRADRWQFFEPPVSGVQKEGRKELRICLGDCE